MNEWMNATSVTVSPPLYLPDEEGVFFSNYLLTITATPPSFFLYGFRPWGLACIHVMTPDPTTVSSYQRSTFKIKTAQK